jgi:hypothetical protein
MKLKKPATPLVEGIAWEMHPATYPKIWGKPFRRWNTETFLVRYQSQIPDPRSDRDAITNAISTPRN